MDNPTKTYETGLKLFEQGDYELASVYLEKAGDAFVACGDKDSAVKAYDKALSCFLNLERNDLVENIRKKINNAK